MVPYGLKWFQNVGSWGPNGPQWSQMEPKILKMYPGGGQMVPKWSPNGPKMVLRWTPKAHFERSRAQTTFWDRF
jgi:hypothetical protein